MKTEALAKPTRTSEPQPKSKKKMKPLQDVVMEDLKMRARSYPFHHKILTWSQADSGAVPEDFGEDIAPFHSPSLLP